MQNLKVAVLAMTCTAFAFAIPSTLLAHDIGNNPAGPNAVIVVPSGVMGAPPSFEVAADFSHASDAGPAFVDFTNTTVADGIAPGFQVEVTESFTNTGTQVWAAANEGFFDIVSVDGGGTAPAFLFAPDHLALTRNGLSLTLGVDYTLVSVPYVDSANNGVQAFEVTFAVGSTIGPGDTLGITKGFWRTVGAGDWELGMAARAAQSITVVPEPATLALLPILAGVTRRRRWR